MTINYKITEQDYLTHLLYNASRSKKMQKKRWRNRITFPTIYVVFGLAWGMLSHKTAPAVLFFILALSWFLIYPIIWGKRHYIKFYKNFITEKKLKGGFNKPVSVLLEEEYFFLKEDGYEIKTMNKEITEVIELRESIFVKFKSGGTLIIPKGEMADLKALVEWLKQLTAKLNVNYQIDDKWKWESHKLF